MYKININNNKHYEEQNTTVTGCILKLSENDVIFKGWFILCLETDSEGLHLDGFRNKQLHCHANGNGGGGCLGPEQQWWAMSGERCPDDKY